MFCPSRLLFQISSWQTTLPARYIVWELLLMFSLATPCRDIFLTYFPYPIFQVQAIRSLELYICYYGLGEYSKRRNRCHSHGVYNVFYFIVAIIPYWMRFLQVTFCYKVFSGNFHDSIGISRERMLLAKFCL